MSKRTGLTNPHLRRLIEELKKKSLENNIPIWNTLAKKLGKPSRKMIEVNLSDIDRHSTKGDMVVVPGVVLASGNLTNAVNVVAWRFSGTAIKKIEEAKGKCMTIKDLIEKNPKGSGVKIIC